MYRKVMVFAWFVVVAAGAAAQAPTGQPLPPAQLQRKAESEVRKLYALGPSYLVKAGQPTETPIPGLLQVSVEINADGQKDSLPFFITKDGRYFMRGEFFDTTKDPFAETRAQMNLANAPFKGPANARVMVVEYADFQCPTCRALYSILKELAPQYPQVRWVFKDFPLDQIHPWAMTAAIAGRCAYQQKPEAFWLFHDQIYQNQEVISPTTVWENMLEYAGNAGLDVNAFRACLASPDTRSLIQASIAEGQKLKIANTPTVFVNGRRMIGADRQTLEQYIKFELAATAPAPTPKP